VEGRNGLTHSQPHPHEQQHFTSSRPVRAPSTSASPAPRNVSPRGFATYPLTRGPSGPAHPPRSPRSYPPELAVDRESFLDRRGLPNDHRDWERERRDWHIGDYPPAPSQMFNTRTHSPAPPYRGGHTPRPVRDYSPPAPSPRNTTHQGVPRHYPPPWADAKNGPPSVSRSPPPLETHVRRYDPRMDGRDETQENTNL
jgi:general transcriptional corepressor CYC8